MAADDPLITVADLRDYMDRSDVALDDGRATFLIAEASAIVRNYTRQTLTAVTDEDLTLLGNGTSILLLPEVPVLAVSDVILDGVDLTETTDYLWTAAGILYHQASVWTWHKAITLTYDHGYEPVPEDIKAAALRLCARLLTRPGASGEIISETLGEHSYQQRTFSATGDSVPAGLLDHEANLLNRYRIRQLV